ncbi:zinc finger CCHC domain-containing protein 17 [Heteronotia binoei]|uniref:zinc finger CCHC domain-containing protein 17 n=1 Tax=Heteronotia binoei TaxID=13085 RepID=UPI0029318B62|nr:zinc finger CCHC domain-containing protein 17 [Heteronotia binoei]
MEVLPELYDIFQGEVAAVTEYGAFIKIPGSRKQGLVHKSHMSSCRIDKPSEMVDVGEKVWVKLIGKEKKDDKLKLSLSMKVVNQGTGKDLDPNNVALDQDARKKRSFKDFSSQKITLEAVLNTVCKKCGCPGHFAKECFVQPGGIKYALIPEEEEDIPPEKEKKAHESEHSAKKRKKEKKKKRKHKSKIPSESDNSDSCNSDIGGDQPSRKKAKHAEKASASQKKKKKKHHKKKHKE